MRVLDCVGPQSSRGKPNSVYRCCCISSSRILDYVAVMTPTYQLLWHWLHCASVASCCLACMRYLAVCMTHLADGSVASLLAQVLETRQAVASHGAGAAQQGSDTLALLAVHLCTAVLLQEVDTLSFHLF